MPAASKLRREALVAMRRAAEYYYRQVASHGGYVYYYSPDLQQRWGEGRATEDQVWVQPPGTPTVGLAYLKAYRATGDPFYLQAATDAALALAYGQLESGGWTNCIDFDPRGERVARYRNGKGRGKNNSSLDDGQTQAAIRLLLHVDHAHQFRHRRIHQTAEAALEALLNAQFPNGGFPQVWTGPVEPQPVRAARFPAYDWRVEGRLKNYWDMYTLNDNVCGYVADTLIDAATIYRDPRYRRAVARLGDFLILAQLPAPQPAWAQQYNYQMTPIWARKFEPPAVAGDESQEVIATLLKISRFTGDPKYLEPIPSALDYLEASLLPSGKLARYYELRTNRPLYMQRTGKSYRLTYDDSDLPGHYGWKWDSRIAQLRREYRAARQGAPLPVPASDARRVQQLVGALDQQGRWLSVYAGERLVGQPKFAEGEKFLSSQQFSANLSALSDFIQSVGESAESP